MTQRKQLCPMPWWRRIFVWRRSVQVISLILLVYGGYFFKKELFATGQGAALIPTLKPPEGSISTTTFQPGSILWPSGATPVLELYPPGLICRFNPQGGMFKACPLHMVAENLTWQTHIRYLLPHITLFLLLCFLFGRMWCGWSCPIGTVGDFLTWIRRRMNVGLRRFSVRLRHTLRTCSYTLLAVTLAISAAIGLPNLARFQCFWFLPYCQICPARLLCPIFGLINPSWKDFSNLITTGFTLLAWLFLGLFVAAFYFGRRVWCHLCPVGLMNSWFNRGAAVELRKKALRCNKCAACTEACPMGLSKMYRLDKDMIYNEQGCIMCFRCVEACPQNECLSAGFFGKQILTSRFDASPVAARRDPGPQATDPRNAQSASQARNGSDRRDIALDTGPRA